MYRPLPDGLTIKNSPIEGLGLFSTINIKINSFIGVTHIRDEQFENKYIRTPLGGFYNHSNNPTFIQSGSSLTLTASSDKAGLLYAENERAIIKNTVFSPYDNNEEKFQKHTYITKIAIYDENMNVLGVAKVAKPVKKTEDREFSFKLKIDI